jgi:hypothetical protein
MVCIADLFVAYFWSMMPRDLDRIRFVARRYPELQGLRLLVLAPTLVAAVWAQPYIRLLRYAGPLEAFVGLVASVAPLLIAMASRAYLDAYYKDRFGNVATTTEHRAKDWGPPMLLLFVGISLDLSGPSPGAPSFVLIAASLIALHITVRDWPFRRHYLPAAVACGLAAWLPAAMPAIRVDSLPDIARNSISLALVFFVAPAYLDHRFLQRTLPRNPDAALEELRTRQRSDAMDEHADTI